MRRVVRKRLDPAEPKFRFVVELTVSRVLRELREKAELSQHGLANRLCVPVGAIRRTELGKLPSLYAIFLFATACGGELRDVLTAVDTAVGLSSPRAKAAAKATATRSRAPAPQGAPERATHTSDGGGPGDA